MLDLQHSAAFAAFQEGTMIRCAIGLLWCTALLGQTPAFEAATVKVNASGGTRPRVQGGPGTGDLGQITYTNVLLQSVMLKAYDIQPYQLSAPDWVTSKRYDIAAKIPPGTTPEQFGAMLRSLLAERFQMVVRHETRELQGFDLVAERGGPKLKASRVGDAGVAAVPLTEPPKRDADGFPVLDRPGLVMMEGVRGKAVVVFLTARAQPVSALTDMMKREFRVPVIDKSGLTGTYDFHLEFAPQPPGALPPIAAADTAPDAADDTAPNLITAVQRLGLRLNSTKATVDVVVVERANPIPVEN
jgi:uncharacterized protein (TIGR03435 family)